MSTEFSETNACCGNGKSWWKKVSKLHKSHKTQQMTYSWSKSFSGFRIPRTWTKKMKSSGSNGNSEPRMCWNKWSQSWQKWSIFDFFANFRQLWGLIFQKQYRILPYPLKSLLYGFWRAFKWYNCFSVENQFKIKFFVSPGQTLVSTLRYRALESRSSLKGLIWPVNPMDS